MDLRNTVTNEKDVVIKLELDDEALKNHMAEFQTIQNARAEVE